LTRSDNHECIKSNGTPVESIPFKNRHSAFIAAVESRPNSPKHPARLIDFVSPVALNAGGAAVIMKAISGANNKK
jgi:hypothetical protein